MPSIFISYSSRDQDFVIKLAYHLENERIAGARPISVWRDRDEISPGENFVDKIEQALASDFVLLILSPDSMESKWVRNEWTAAFNEQTKSGRVKLVCVHYRKCQVPSLLSTAELFDLRDNHPEGFRQIATWLHTERPTPPSHVNPLPTRPPLFVGREADLELLFKKLLPGVVLGLSGMPGRGKTTLALEFAHRAQTQFASVYWLACQSGSLASIAGDLARQLGLSLTGDIQQVVSELKLECARQRCLLILDNVETDEPGALIPGGVASVLVTTRQPGLRFLRNHPESRLDLFSEEQCLALFRKVVGEEEVIAHEADCRTLFRKAGYLPLAIDLSACAVKYDLYTIPSLAASFPPDITTYIADVIQELPAEPRKLLAAMSVCAPEAFRIPLAASVAEMSEADCSSALRYLVSRSMVDELNRGQSRYRLHALIRATACDTPTRSEFAQLHAEAVYKQFKSWEVDWKTCEQDLPDFQLALNWAINNESPFAADLAFNGSALTNRRGRLNESFEIRQSMTEYARKRKDKKAEQRWLGNQALILKAWGKLEGALALHKIEEDVCRQLHLQKDLQRSLGNQAVILMEQERVAESLKLFKEQEEICI